MRHIVLSSVAVIALSFSILGCGGDGSNSKSISELNDKSQPNQQSEQINSVDSEFALKSGEKIITGLNANYNYSVSNSDLFEILAGDQYTDNEGNPIKVLAFKEVPVDGEYILKLTVQSGDVSTTLNYKIVVGNASATTTDNSSTESSNTVKVLTFSMPTTERVFQTDAASYCQAPSFLPSMTQLLENKDKVWDAVESFDSDGNSSNGVAFGSVVWSSDLNKGLWFKDGALANAQEYTTGDTDTYYVVCATETDAPANEEASEESQNNNENSSDSTATISQDQLVTIGTSQWLKVDTSAQKSWSEANSYCQSIGMRIPTKEEAKMLLIGYNDVNGTFTGFNTEVIPQSIANSVVWLEEDDPGLSAWTIYLGGNKFLSYDQTNSAYVTCIK